MNTMEQSTIISRVHNEYLEGQVGLPVTATTLLTNLEMFKLAIRGNGYLSNLRDYCPSCLQLPKGQRCQSCKAFRKAARQARKELGLCTNCGPRPAYSGRLLCQECYTSMDRTQDQYRKKVFNHYGHQCTCCGSRDNLAIDHIHPGLKKIDRDPGTGLKDYRNLIKRGFPAGYQVLCKPCNSSKHRGPVCRMHPRQYQ